ncbi:unnamed protein product [Didymodactylos carnosus]|uniref:protein kinase C n=1 Tax=Didymodactylos carnosus TaxID=1234261 RepID=A0A814G3Y9_9BILA|nr:unnamed protein product [Didymodactylos carnosus]CAF3765035.1 unnamed protein product [Didymodactylos carnosus]
MGNRNAFENSNNGIDSLIQTYKLKVMKDEFKRRSDSFKFHLRQDVLKAQSTVEAKKIDDEAKLFLHIPCYDLTYQERIGQGAFADVYLGKWLSRHHCVAIKIVRITHLTDTVKQGFLNEIATMYKSRYEHVLGVLGACMEPNYYALVCDFGLAKIRSETSRQSASFSEHQTAAGTLRWKAPELLKLGKPSTASDVYSLGVVFWEVATRLWPTSALPLPIIHKQEDRVTLGVHDLVLYDHCSIFDDNDYEKIYVSIEFLNYPSEELETPYSLPKEVPYTTYTFNFQKGDIISIRLYIGI